MIYLDIITRIYLDIMIYLDIITRIYLDNILYLDNNYTYPR